MKDVGYNLCIITFLPILPPPHHTPSINIIFSCVIKNLTFHMLNVHGIDMRILMRATNMLIILLSLFCQNLVCVAVDAKITVLFHLEKWEMCNFDR